MIKLNLLICLITLLTSLSSSDLSAQLKLFESEIISGTEVKISGMTTWQPELLYETDDSYHVLYFHTPKVTRFFSNSSASIDVFDKKLKYLESYPLEFEYLFGIETSRNTKSLLSIVGIVRLKNEQPRLVFSRDIEEEEFIKGEKATNEFLVSTYDPSMKNQKFDKSAIPYRKKFGYDEYPVRLIHSKDSTAAAILSYSIEELEENIILSAVAFNGDREKEWVSSFSLTNDAFSGENSSFSLCEDGLVITNDGRILLLVQSELSKKHSEYEKNGINQHNYILEMNKDNRYEVYKIQGSKNGEIHQLALFSNNELEIIIVGGIAPDNEVREVGLFIEKYDKTGKKLLFKSDQLTPSVENELSRLDVQYTDHLIESKLDNSYTLIRELGDFEQVSLVKVDSEGKINNYYFFEKEQNFGSSFLYAYHLHKDLPNLYITYLTGSNMGNALLRSAKYDISNQITSFQSSSKLKSVLNGLVPFPGKFIEIKSGKYFGIAGYLNSGGQLKYAPIVYNFN